MRRLRLGIKMTTVCTEQELDEYIKKTGRIPYVAEVLSKKVWAKNMRELKCLNKIEEA
jgi:hypothetical protein